MVKTDNPTDLGTVSQCDASHCIYNQQRQCLAGALKLSFIDEFPQCYTYTEEPASEELVGMGVGDVSQCDVIDCIYNEGQKCVAQLITVSYLHNVAQCSTYKSVQFI
ncbi:MAG: DUF1540 domain-containing protein [Microcystaceae cyanobacterium]